MGAPSNNQFTQGAFPHDHIRENGYRMSPGEERILCTVYQKTPVESQENLRTSLMSYIDWRCNTSEGQESRHIDQSVKYSPLHLCNHIIDSKSKQGVDKDVLSEFSGIIESDGITRLDLLWNMKSYRKWFDTAPGAFVIEVAA